MISVPGQNGALPSSNGGSKKEIKPVDMDKLTKILNFVGKHREMRGHSATKLETLKLSDDELGKVYEKMECQSCGKIPHTFRRYSCLRGHFYCDMCYRERLLKFENENPHASEPHAICGHAISPEKVDAVGCSHGILSEATASVMTAQDKERMKLELEKGTCLLVLQNVSYDADPLYHQLFGNAKWKCPFVGDEGEEVWCTNKGVDGWYIHRHIRMCFEKYIGK